ncbi:beta-ketoacyl synthase N-terminal-like domain-containing protein [Streptomyces sp. TRM68367]|uniref:beta-ketoacyl synthase N-terminal-like domain-containing protein n=1 Tax=Streptomyces sp. TRM68367 TaxID=2758415 RepID=UPI00165C7088|nr:beta-ketoacyl synthase N-terminal-like domain-containing protein [Streptomyces sp. TRM68367]MBC9724537.1 3-oxoacyl-ACP synthase [Streptomyces sp. TRM68367]
MTDVSADELVVTGSGVVTPWGDAPELAAAAGGVPMADADDWFDHRERLGPRGYKYLPAAAQYALAAARGALADGGLPDAVPADRRGLLLATNAGLAGLFDAMDATVAESGAAGISPASAPYFAVNVLGNRLAVELALNGFALTVATARTAALDALSTAALVLASGRADALVLAATEEPVPDGRGGGGEQGAAVLTLETPAGARARGSTVRAAVRARSLFVPPAALADPAGRTRADRALTTALAELAAPGDRPVMLHLDLDDSPVAEAVASAAAARRPIPSGDAPLTDTPGPPSLSPAAAPGPRTGCLGPALAVAHAVTAQDGAARLVVCATGAGHVALVRVSPVAVPSVSAASVEPPRRTQESEHAEVA